MAEETRDPVRIFPRIMLLGLTITAAIYVLVAICSVALVPPAELGEGEAPLLKVVEAGAPAFPLGVFAVISMCAVANSALINMLMASRLLYGMAQDGTLPLALGKVGERRTPWVAIMFTTVLTVGPIAVADLRSRGGTTSLLLLVVFTVCNAAVLVLRRDKVEHKHFRAPTFAPVVGVVVCAFLASPLSQRDSQDYVVAGWLMAAGVATSDQHVRHLGPRLGPLSGGTRDDKLDVVRMGGDDHRPLRRYGFLVRSCHSHSPIGAVQQTVLPGRLAKPP